MTEPKTVTIFVCNANTSELCNRSKGDFPRMNIGTKSVLGVGTISKQDYYIGCQLVMHTELPQ